MAYTGDYSVPKWYESLDVEGINQSGKDIITGYENAIAGQETLPAMRSRLEGQYNIPQYRDTLRESTEALSGVTSQIAKIPETTAATTRESLVTAGQAGKMNQAAYAKLAPLAESLGETVEKVSSMLTQAEQNLNTQAQYEIAQQKKELDPWTWKYNWNETVSAMKQTGWSTELSTELNRLLSNQQAGITLSEGEKNRANELAKIEKNFQNQLTLQEKQSEYYLDLWG